MRIVIVVVIPGTMVEQQILEDPWAATTWLGTCYRTTSCGSKAENIIQATIIPQLCEESTQNSTEVKISELEDLCNWMEHFAQLKCCVSTQL